MRLDWKPIDENTPRGPDAEIMLYYRNWCGAIDFVVSGHWDCQEGREFEATWAHSCGYGDADMWAEIPEGPKGVNNEVIQRENEAMKITLYMIANTAHNMVVADRITASEARQQFAGINTLAEPWGLSPSSKAQKDISDE